MEALGDGMVCRSNTRKGRIPHTHQNYSHTRSDASLFEERFGTSQKYHRNMCRRGGSAMAFGDVFVMGIPFEAANRRSSARAEVSHENEILRPVWPCGGVLAPRYGRAMRPYLFTKSGRYLLCYVPRDQWHSHHRILDAGCVVQWSERLEMGPHVNRDVASMFRPPFSPEETCDEPGGAGAQDDAPRKGGFGSRTSVNDRL